MEGPKDLLIDTFDCGADIGRGGACGESAQRCFCRKMGGFDMFPGMSGTRIWMRRASAAGVAAAMTLTFSQAADIAMTDVTVSCGASFLHTPNTQMYPG